MKTWIYFYIKHTLKNAKPFSKEPGWALNHKIKSISLQEDGG